MIFSFFKTLYYVLGVAFAYYKNKNFKKLPIIVKQSIERSENKKDHIDLDKSPEGFTEDQKHALNSFMFFLWVVIGLFTFQDVLYFALLIVNIIINQFTKHFEYNFAIRLRIAQFYYIITWTFCWIVVCNAYLFLLSSKDITNLITIFFNQIK